MFEVTGCTAAWSLDGGRISPRNYGRLFLTTACLLIMAVRGGRHVRLPGLPSFT
jgi:hypothetical protein